MNVPGEQTNGLAFEVAHPQQSAPEIAQSPLDKPSLLQRGRQFGVAVAATCLLIPAGLAPSYSAEGEAPIAVPHLLTPQLPIDCDIDTPLPPPKPLSELRKDVADMEFAIDRGIYDQLALDITMAKSKAEVGNILGSYLRRYGDTVTVDDLPPTEPARQFQYSKRFDQLSLDEVKDGGKNMLRQLSKTPVEDTRNISYYLTSSTLYPNSAGYIQEATLGPVYPDNPRRQDIVMDISNGEVAAITAHEVGHAEHKRVCGDKSWEKPDQLFVQVSGPDFQYAGKDDKRRASLYSSGVTITNYAGTSWVEENAVGTEVLRDKGFPTDINPKTPAAKKLNIVAMRDEAATPGVISLLRYLPYTNGRDFPGDTAREGTPFPECQVDQPEIKQLVSDSGATVHYAEELFPPTPEQPYTEQHIMYAVEDSPNIPNELEDELTRKLHESGQLIPDATYTARVMPYYFEGPGGGSLLCGQLYMSNAPESKRIGMK